MAELRFEWDERKADVNQRKHKVAFEEAKTVFFDDRAVEFYDEEHSESEDRFLMLGLSAKLRMLIVCYCLRQEGSVIRIISARRATKNESQFYPEGEA
jgi:uncharacterized DUF497 family protein